MEDLQGDLAVASVYGGSGCVELKGPQVVDELQELLRLLTLCMLFSKKPFSEFLDSAGFSLNRVLLHNPKAEVRTFFYMLVGIGAWKIRMLIAMVK